MASGRVMPGSSRGSVSVILPCFRCASTLVRALDSVSSQRLLPVEVILVDDGNAGADRQTIESCAGRYPQINIRLIACSENKGAAAARNLGWEHAKGEYVAFLDADDSWHPNKLELQYSWMRLHPEVVLSGHAINHIRAERPEATEIRLAEWYTISRGALLLSNRFQTSSAMVRRDLGFRFCNEKRYSEDYLLWLMVVLNGKKAARSNAVLAYSYKPFYGSGGLSKDLWRMEQGELDTYRRVRNQRLIGALSYQLLRVHSLIKAIRRVLLVRIRNCDVPRVGSRTS